MQGNQDDAQTQSHIPANQEVALDPALIVGAALGLRHGTDPDHLAAIDGLTRLRPNPANGVFFALGHGLTVMLLAVGIGTVLASRFSALGPWTLIVIGTLNLWRMVRGKANPSAVPRPIVAQPFLLGVMLAAGFETASQLSALLLAGRSTPWLLGLTFSGGMVLVDGLDGFLAASTQRLASAGRANAKVASRMLAILVITFSFGLGGAQLLGLPIDQFALPLGLILFAIVIGIRIWSRRPSTMEFSKEGLEEGVSS
jgi:nickel/cobalt transporter (NiCoT) family protein